MSMEFPVEKYEILQNKNYLHLAEGLNCLPSPPQELEQGA